MAASFLVLLQQGPRPRGYTPQLDPQDVVAWLPPPLTIAENEDTMRSTFGLPHSGQIGTAGRFRRWVNTSKT